MRTLAACAAALALLPGAAPADVIVCEPNSLVSWSSGEAVELTYYPDDTGNNLVWVDLDTGDYRLEREDGSDRLDGRYQVTTTSDDFIGFDPSRLELLRVRLTNTEWQFMRDSGRQIEVGTCSYAGAIGEGL